MIHKVMMLVVLVLVVLVPGSTLMAETEDYLNYGLYWMGSDNAKTKFVEGEDNAYYDPDKPTVIFFHGWQQDSSEDNYAIVDLYWDDAGVYTQNSWIEAGYNVGTFHWAQWADEDDVQWAESKIWSREGTKGFRYRLSDGTYSTALNPDGDEAVGELAADIIIEALEDNASGSLRLAGHSLGAQLATRVAEIFYEKVEAGSIDSDIYTVDRLALLDPAWTQSGKSWLGDSNGDGDNDWVGERNRWAIAEMISNWDGFACEMYSTTALSETLGISMDSNQDLQDMVASVDVRPWYYSSWELTKKHNAAYFHYFYSMDADPPTECTISWWRRKSTGEDAASAATSNSRIQEMMGDDNYWDQVEGRYTEDTSDDWFEKKD